MTCGKYDQPFVLTDQIDTYLSLEKALEGSSDRHPTQRGHARESLCLSLMRAPSVWNYLCTNHYHHYYHHYHYVRPFLKQVMSFITGMPGRYIPNVHT